MKKLLSIILCLLLVCRWAGAEMCIRMDSGALLLDRDGGEIVSLGVYDDIVPVSDTIYAAGRDGLYALMDASGSLLGEFAYTFLESSGNVILAESNGMQGLLSPDGTPHSRFEYTRILPVGDGRFWAIKDDGSDFESDELFIIGPDGNETATGLFIRRMQPAGELGLLAVLRPTSGLWGYCDAAGEMIISARYSHAGPFLHGLAPVVENGFYGAISPDGRAVIEPEYDYLEICTGGFVLAGLSQQGVWVFDLNGNTIARYDGEETAAAPVGEGYAVYDGESLTLYGAGGEAIARGGQDSSVYEGLDGQLILADGPWGEACVGIVGTQPRYQNLYPLGWADSDPVYAFMEANSARYINDLLGEVQLSVDMDSARYGIADSRGETLIPAEFDSLVYLEDDRFLARLEDYLQVMDTAGNIYWSHGIRQTEEPSS